MPIVISNWCKDPIKPIHSSGESEIRYGGMILADKPQAIPIKNLPKQTD